MPSGRCYVPDMVSYDCHSVFQFRNIDAYSKHLRMCFSHMAAPAIIETHELSITVDEQVAFCHLTMPLRLYQHKAAANISRGCVRPCLRKVDGQWLIRCMTIARPRSIR